MFFVSLYKDNKRYRISNGEKIGINLKSNSFPVEKRNEMGKLLASEVYKFLQSHKKLVYNRATDENKTRTNLEYPKLALDRKLKSNLSKKYLETLEFIYLKIKEISKDGKVNEKTIEKLLCNYGQYIFKTWRS